MARLHHEGKLYSTAQTAQTNGSLSEKLKVQLEDPRYVSGRPQDLHRVSTSRLHQHWKYDALMYVNHDSDSPRSGVVRELNAAIQDSQEKFTGVTSLALISVYPFGETIRTRNESYFRPLALQDGRILGVDH
jgi:hypothetical protein